MPETEAVLQGVLGSGSLHAVPHRTSQKALLAHVALTIAFAAVVGVHTDATPIKSVLVDEHERSQHRDVHMTNGLRGQNDIYVAVSPLHGKGVFASRDVSSDVVVAVCDYVPTGLSWWWAYWLLDAGGMREYCFGGKDSEGVLALGPCSLFNHGCKNSNVVYTFDHDNRIMVVQTTRKVTAGEELLLDYGPKYWCSRSKSFFRSSDPGCSCVGGDTP